MGWGVCASGCGVRVGVRVLVDFVSVQHSREREIGEKGEWECKGGNEYLNKVFDVLDEYWQ